MGRHRRATPAPAPAAPAGAPHTARPEVGGRHRAGQRRRETVPVRTGLLSASAAMAMGAVAVASGLVPGVGGQFGSAPGSGRVQADGMGDPETGGGLPDPSPTADRELPDDGERGERASERPGTPSAEPSRTEGRPSAKPEPSRNDGEKPETSRPSEEAGSGTGSGPGKDTGRQPSPKPEESTAPERSGESAAEAEVLRLVNDERAKAGCPRVTADPELAELAGDFSQDMARRGFFSHTTPDGKSPWDRAEESGITGLGGENIARGQANARSVMDSWMNSPGHRANILNCDYRTLGVGTHFAEGGPWWTQDFGF
ncbi:CAP domain-containing protein [Streptomyces sp. AJS327]|uniref:CAP domain-containing protein n=1 Tax=Streptomyces sp. AJS327 TaxID=2545265 RepID=UPI0015DDA6EA|nr:CAP domain-containing protein [Streptomyces sp. AJS327]MBA0051794.1 CAP domain-containing protein [Streptomyces sp. AJS327]